MADISKGTVGTLIAGVGALILVTIVVLVIVSTVDDAKLLRDTATTTTVVNETGWINSTTYTLANVDGLNRNFAIVIIKNTSGAASAGIGSANYTFTAVSGTLNNISAGGGSDWRNVKITYTYIAPTNYEKSTTGLAKNFTAGLNNVSGKIPTILLIGAVVLLFGVIILLIRQAQSMGFGTRQGSL